MIDIHLYGKLRRFARDQDPTSPSIVAVTWESGDTIRSIVLRLGIPLTDLGSNMFLNGRYATLDATVQDGDRLGLFPDDMQLLYKWYFSPSQGSAAAKSRQGSPDSTSPIGGGTKSEG